MDVTFLNIVDNTKETELNLFSDRKKWEKQIEKIFSRPEDYLVVFEGTECLYGCPKHLGVYVGSPVSLETKKIFSEKAFRGFQKTWIKLNNTRLEIYDSYDGWNKSMFPVKRFNASELKQELESKD